MKHHLHDRIPVIDLFAGPGGLAEGFSAFRAEGGNGFRILLSVEKDLCSQ
jgi:DNA (cytosine-5)-methyltransferase 1